MLMSCRCVFVFEVPDIRVLPPDHSITSPAKQQESPAIKGTERSLSVPNKTAAAPNKNTKVDVYGFHLQCCVKVLAP